jgi:hypothetical protein
MVQSDAVDLAMKDTFLKNILQLFKSLYHCKVKSSLDLMQRPGYLSRWRRELYNGLLHFDFTVIISFKEELYELIDDEVDGSKAKEKPSTPPSERDTLQTKDEK